MTGPYAPGWYDDQRADVEAAERMADARDHARYIATFFAGVKAAR